MYARVSSHHQRADLERQVARVTAWATAGGLPVHGVVTEMGSGLNGNHRTLRRPLAHRQVSASPGALQRLRRRRAVGEATGKRAPARSRRSHPAPVPAPRDTSAPASEPSPGPPSARSMRLGKSADRRPPAPARSSRTPFLPARRLLLGCGLEGHLRLPGRRSGRQGKAGAGASAQAARFDDATGRRRAGRRGGGGAEVGTRRRVYAKCWPPLTSMASPVR